MEIGELKQLTLDLLPENLFLFDGKGRILYTNRAFCARFPGDEGGDFGRAVGCEHALAGAACGSGAPCGYCKLKAMVEACARRRESSVQKFALGLGRAGEERAVTFRASVSPIGEDYGVCLLEDFSETAEERDADADSKYFARDLQKAKDIQARLLPNPMDVFSLCDFIYLYQQQYRVGGDFFDIYKIDDHTFGAYIADVSGSGVSGGFITVFLSDNMDKTDKSPARALSHLNEKFRELDMGEESSITIFAMVFDKNMGTIRYCNGGHNQPAILKRGSEIRTFECDGAPISNWGLDFTYKDYALQYRRGDKLVLFTDGVADIKNSEGEPFGVERICEAVAECPDEMNIILNHLGSEVKDFYGKERVTDDLTILVLDLK